MLMNARAGGADGARARASAHASLPRAPARNTRRYLPICTSSPPASAGGVDALAVEVGAVEAADVADDEAAALADELRVPAGHGHVVEEDVALRVAAGGRDVGVEQEAAAGVGAALDDEQRAAGRQRPRAAPCVVGAARRRGRRLVLERALERGQRDRRGRLDRPLAAAGPARSAAPQRAQKRLPSGF